jgi:predicted RNase H-like HicB family nuclease
MNLNFTVAIQQEEDLFVANCLENHIASQGSTIHEAIDNLKEALELYYDNEEKPKKSPPVFVTTMEVTI